jgi:hypothetical protein
VCVCVWKRRKGRIQERNPGNMIIEEGEVKKDVRSREVEGKEEDEEIEEEKKGKRRVVKT